MANSREANEERADPNLVPDMPEPLPTAEVLPPATDQYDQAVTIFVDSVDRPGDTLIAESPDDPRRLHMYPESKLILDFLRSHPGLHRPQRLAELIMKQQVSASPDHTERAIAYARHQFHVLSLMCQTNILIPQSVKRPNKRPYSYYGLNPHIRFVDMPPASTTDIQPTPPDITELPAAKSTPDAAAAEQPAANPRPAEKKVEPPPAIEHVTLAPDTALPAAPVSKPAPRKKSKPKILPAPVKRESKPPAAELPMQDPDKLNIKREMAPWTMTHREITTFRKRREELKYTVEHIIASSKGHNDFASIVYQSQNSPPNAQAQLTLEKQLFTFVQLGLAPLLGTPTELPPNQRQKALIQMAAAMQILSEHHARSGAEYMTHHISRHLLTSSEAAAIKTEALFSTIVDYGKTNHQFEAHLMRIMRRLVIAEVTDKKVNCEINAYTSQNMSLIQLTIARIQAETGQPPTIPELTKILGKTPDYIYILREAEAHSKAMR